MICYDMSVRNVMIQNNWEWMQFKQLLNDVEIEPTWMSKRKSIINRKI